MSAAGVPAWCNPAAMVPAERLAELRVEAAAMTVIAAELVGPAAQVAAWFDAVEAELDAAAMTAAGADAGDELPAVLASALWCSVGFDRELLELLVELLERGGVEGLLLGRFEAVAGRYLPG